MSRLRSRVTIATPLVVAGLMTLSFTLVDATPASSTPAATRSDATQVDAVEPSGNQLYASQCISCHGVDATGVDGRGPSLLTEGPASVDFVLRTGRMPLADPNEQATRRLTRYSEAEIVALVDYVGGLGSGPEIPLIDILSGDLANGGKLFRLNCAACHVATGSGSVIGSDRRAPSLVPSSPTEVAEAIMVGPGAMPIFGQLDESDINDITGYIEALQTENPTGPRSLGGIGPVAEGLAAWLIALVPLIALTRWIGRGRTDPEPVSHSLQPPTGPTP